MWKSLPSACSLCPASNRPSSWGTATPDRQQRFLPPPRGRMRCGRREGGRPGDHLKGKPFLFSLFSPHCAGLREKPVISPCSSYTSPAVFPFLRCLSLSYSPMNTTGKTVLHLFFSTHVRHCPPTSSTVRHPGCRFPSSYNHPFCPFLILGGLCRTFQLIHAKSPPLSKAFDSACNDISRMICFTTSSLRSCYAKCYI